MWNMFDISLPIQPYSLEAMRRDPNTQFWTGDSVFALVLDCNSENMTSFTPLWDTEPVSQQPEDYELFEEGTQSAILTIGESVMDGWISLGQLAVSNGGWVRNDMYEGIPNLHAMLSGTDGGSQNIIMRAWNFLKSLALSIWQYITAKLGALKAGIFGKTANAIGMIQNILIQKPTAMILWAIERFNKFMGYLQQFSDFLQSGVSDRLEQITSISITQYKTGRGDPVDADRAEQIIASYQKLVDDAKLKMDEFNSSHDMSSEKNQVRLDRLAESLRKAEQLKENMSPTASRLQGLASKILTTLKVAPILALEGPALIAMKLLQKTLTIIRTIIGVFTLLYSTVGNFIMGSAKMAMNMAQLGVDITAPNSGFQSERAGTLPMKAAQKIYKVGTAVVPPENRPVNKFIRKFGIGK